MTAPHDARFHRRHKARPRLSPWCDHLVVDRRGADGIMTADDLQTILDVQTILDGRVVVVTMTGASK